MFFFLLKFLFCEKCKLHASSLEDADATLTSPMLLGVCDGVSQLEAREEP